MELYSKDGICLIRARSKNDYCFEAFLKMGYTAFIPYKDRTLFLRCLREVWFRMKLPRREIWFNNALKKFNARIFIVKDPLMCPEFLTWLHKQHPNARILLDYDNRVGRSLNPESVNDEIIEKWTYDSDDAAKYGMNLKTPFYLDIYRMEPAEKKDTDVLYLGRDKGRLEEILGYEKEFQRRGLRTYFHICADRSFLRFRNKHYRPLMSYQDYLERLSRSNAVLNIMPHDQTSLTMREFEAAFDRVKCITTNRGILSSELYHPSRYFVIGYDDMSKLEDFFKEEFLPVSEDVLSKFTFDYGIKYMVSKCAL